MTETFDNLRYQLDDLLSEGFRNQDQYEVYLDLKKQYETATDDNSFSIRELTGQLETILTNRENFFPDLEEGVRSEYLDLVERLREMDQEKAGYYLRQLEKE